MKSKVFKIEYLEILAFFTYVGCALYLSAFHGLGTLIDALALGVVLVMTYFPLRLLIGSLRAGYKDDALFAVYMLVGVALMWAGVICFGFMDVFYWITGSFIMCGMLVLTFLGAAKGKKA